MRRFLYVVLTGMLCVLLFSSLIDRVGTPLTEGHSLAPIPVFTNANADAVAVGSALTLSSSPKPELKVMPSPSKTIYVSNTGNDDYSGSIELPFKTIQAGIEHMNPGDTLYVRGGIYYEKLKIDKSGSEAQGYITISGMPGEIAIIDGSKIQGEDLIYIKDQSYIKLAQLELQNNRGNDFMKGVYIEGKGEAIELNGLRIHDIETTDALNGGAHGIGVYGTDALDGITIIGCEVYALKLGWSEAIAINGNVTNASILQNSVHDADNIGIDFIGFEGTAVMNDQARDSQCIDNVVYNISSKENPAYEGDLGADGIYVDGGERILLERNRVYNCDIGIEAASEHFGKLTKDTMIRNNLIYNCELYGISFGGSEYENGRAEGIQILNNTLYSNGIQINIQQANSATNTISNNILYLGEGIEGRIGKNQFENNMMSDPKFVNVDQCDFRLSPMSKAIDAGQKVDYGTYDLGQSDRVYGSQVDMGCYEWHTQ